MMKLFTACLFGHADRVRSRDDQGRLILVCDRCGDVHVPLQSQVELSGPAHQPAVVKGTPNVMAKKESWFGKRRSA